MKALQLIASLAALVAPVFAQANPRAVSGYTTAHDPSVCKVNGTYYTFTTGVGLPTLTSTDRSRWTLSGLVWPSGASWTDPYTGASNANLWAPKCVYANNQFYLYYSASSFGSQRSAIFLATSSTARPGSWTNQGLVIESSSSNPYNAIDPDVFIENGKWTFSWGSWWQGIYATSNINPTTGKLTSTSGYVNLANRGGKGIEASTIYKSGSYYYLFSSWDACCAGTSSTYNIRFGRSSSVLGPYVDQAGVSLASGGGTLLLGTHGGIYGPGHQDVLNDGGSPLLFYHYYTSAGHFLGINGLSFTSGWPVLTA